MSIEAVTGVTQAIPPLASASSKADTAAIDAAQKALAKANSDVATDKRNHSPDCVAFDQKQADKAALQLAQAKAAQQQAATTAQGTTALGGNTVDITA